MCQAETPNPCLQTLKLRGELRGIPIQVLVDSEASHNFISRKLVLKLALPTTSFSGLYIRLGDGHHIWVQERCKKVCLKLGEFSSKLIAMVFELENLDMVLGMDWLKTLEEVTHNWKEQSIRFLHGTQSVELYAISSTMDSPVALHIWLAKQP